MPTLDKSYYNKSASLVCHAQGFVNLYVAVVNTASRVSDVLLCESVRQLSVLSVLP